MNKISLKSKFVAILAFLVSSVFLLNNVSFAKTSEEIGADIANQQGELSEKQKELKALQDSLAGYESAAASSQGELPKLQAELDKADAEAKAKTLELELFKQSKVIKELEREQRQVDQQETLNNSYMEWRSVNINLDQFINTDYDFLKIEKYASSLTGAQQKNIFSLAKDLKQISKDIEDYDKKIKELEELKVTLAAKKKELEDKIAMYNSVLAYGSSLGDSIQSLQNSITNLSGEQQAALQRENQILSNPPAPSNPGTPPQAGSFVFRSQGRDLYQGHGVGMSQYGAHGMGNAGYSYQDILKFYFTGVAISGGYENTTITIKLNKGNNNIETRQMNIEDFTAGQAEVPTSWPAEAVKAQVVAFRSYVLKYVALYGALNVCLDSAYRAGTCSTSTVAFNDTQNTRAAVDQTRGIVVTYNGSPIEALYSLDNNQGSGTANNDTIFQNIYGDGTPYPYLRAVNDAAVATNTYYTYWQQQTNSYTYDQIKEMILYNANAGYYDGGTSNVLKALIQDIGGGITSMSFERDPSQRVKKVWFTGPNGQQRSMGGWWFKNLWTNWVYDRGTNDYIYSQTFYLVQ